MPHHKPLSLDDCWGRTSFCPTPGTRRATYASKLAVDSACAAPSEGLPACACPHATLAYCCPSVFTTTRCLVIHNDQVWSSSIMCSLTSSLLSMQACRHAARISHAIRKRVCSLGAPRAAAAAARRPRSTQRCGRCPPSRPGAPRLAAAAARSPAAHWAAPAPSRHAVRAPSQHPPAQRGCARVALRAKQTL